MITQRLQWFAIIVGILFLVMMIELIRKNKVALKYALLWLLSGILLLLLAIFPQLGAGICWGMSGLFIRVLTAWGLSAFQAAMFRGGMGFLLLLAIFPHLLDSMARMIGIYSPVNALFAVLLCCGLVLMISFSVIMSGNKKAIVRLTQEISLMENRIRQMEGKPAAEDGAAEEKK